MRPTTIIHVVLFSLGVAAAMPLLADGRAKVPVLLHKEKSTLENFPLQSLEQEDLASAVIGGTLDAPAAGNEEESPQLSNFMPKEMEPAEDLSDMGRYNVPAAFDIRPQPAAVEGRTYSWDYTTTQR